MINFRISLFQTFSRAFIPNLARLSHNRGRSFPPLLDSFRNSENKNQRDSPFNFFSTFYKASGVFLIFQAVQHTDEEESSQLDESNEQVKQEGAEGAEKPITMILITRDDEDLENSYLRPLPKLSNGKFSTCVPVHPDDTKILMREILGPDFHTDQPVAVLLKTSPFIQKWIYYLPDLDNQTKESDEERSKICESAINDLLQKLNEGTLEEHVMNGPIPPHDPTHPNVLECNRELLDKLVDSGTELVVLAQMTDCPYCARFKKDFLQVADLLKDEQLLFCIINSDFNDLNPKYFPLQQGFPLIRYIQHREDIKDPTYYYYGKGVRKEGRSFLEFIRERCSECNFDLTEKLDLFKDQTLPSIELGQDEEDQPQQQSNEE
eukprot:TRINITY_DN2966_c0_g1_i1.p1 TRINITY_DN2966_c0_g1~~TRINITY_DN2966_c0_g1_i1.p1  ORF type:complete len:378 (+),score=70.94 TRINITY_DN2966_c0_g1_i1:3-1136(+)